MWDGFVGEHLTLFSELADRTPLHQTASPDSRLASSASCFCYLPLSFGRGVAFC